MVVVFIHNLWILLQIFWECGMLIEPLGGDCLGEKMRNAFKKHRHIISYLFFGVLTTAVDSAFFYPLYNLAHWNITLCKTIAWIAAVIFAYFTNKIYVYNSRDWSAKVAIPEFLQFVGSRLASFILTIVLIFITAEVLLWNGNIMNILVAVLVVIMNYLTGKILFRKK